MASMSDRDLRIAYPGASLKDARRMAANGGALGRAPSTAVPPTMPSKAAAKPATTTKPQASSKHSVKKTTLGPGKRFAHIVAPVSAALRGAQDIVLAGRAARGEGPLLPPAQPETKPEPCDACNGTGVQGGEMCADCNGAGVVSGQPDEDGSDMAATARGIIAAGKLRRGER